MTRIGLISDVHATPAPVHEALRMFQSKNVDLILCAGDIAGYGNKLEQTMELLLEHDCRAVAGNHDLWYFENPESDREDPATAFLGALPFSLTLEIAATRVLMVHASPADPLMDGIRLLDETGTLAADQQHFWADALINVPADILVVGHTHQVFAERLGHLLVINPGSAVFNHTCMILSLPEQSVEILPLSGKEPILSWNFSMFKNSILANE